MHRTRWVRTTDEMMAMAGRDNASKPTYKQVMGLLNKFLALVVFTSDSGGGR